MSNEINLVSVFKLFKKSLVWIVLVGLLFSLSLSLYYRFFENRQNPIVNSTLQILPNVSAFDKNVDSMNLQLALYDKSLKNIYEMARSEKIVRDSTEEAKLGQSVLKSWDQDVQIKYIGESGLLQISVQLDSLNDSNLLVNAMINRIQEEIQKKYPLVTSSVYSPAAVDLFKSVQNEVSKIQLILSFLIGLIIACICIYFVDYFNGKIKSAKELEEIAQHPLLTTMKKSTEVESAKIIIPILSSMTDSKTPKSYLFLSINEDQSKIRLIQNIAKSLNENGKKVLLIDADMRFQSLSKKLKYENAEGLAQALQKKIDNPDLAIRKSSFGADVLPSGKIENGLSASDLLASDNFKEIMKTLSTQYDHILVNANSFSSFADSAIISSIVDVNVITVQQDKISFNQMKDTVRTLKKLDAKIAGFIFTDTY